MFDSTMFRRAADEANVSSICVYTLYRGTMTRFPKARGLGQLFGPILHCPNFSVDNARSWW